MLQAVARSFGNHQREEMQFLRIQRRITVKHKSLCGRNVPEEERRSSLQHRLVERSNETL